MTDRTHPEAGSTHIIRYALELGLLWVDGSGRHKVREALNALDALEAKLASIGAGGVQALSAAPAGFVPVSAFDRLHAHAESLAERLLAAEQDAPKAAPQQEAQEPMAIKAMGYGGSTGINDYLMSDGTIKAMRPSEVVWAAPQPAPAPLSDAVEHYLEAQDALDNREYGGINAEPYEKLLRRRNASRKDLDAALAAQKDTP